MKRLPQQFTLISLLTLACTSPLYAAEGVYFSGGLGFSDVNSMPASYSEVDERNTSFRFAVGYAKDLKPSFGLGAELAYNNYGSYEYTYTGLKYSFSSVDVLGKATWHVQPSWDIYGKLGVARETVDTNSSYVDNDSDMLPEIGLGTSYFMNDQFSLDFSIYQTFGDDIQADLNDDDNAPSITTVNLSVSYYLV